MRILVSGGAGFVGAHTTIALLSKSHDVQIIDNFSNSTRSSVGAIERIVGQSVGIHEVDIRNFEAVKRVISGFGIDTIIHFAALKSVSDSFRDPVEYWDVNVSGSISLVKAAVLLGVQRFLFSSSATVYDPTSKQPLSEGGRLKPQSPYGDTKLSVESFLRSIPGAYPAIRTLSLRYFNPVGAHESGLLGEAPLGTPTNLFPIILEVIKRKRPYLEVFGGDYKTRDGTAIRDYIHVMDVAEGHVAALNVLESGVNFPADNALNLGTGIGHTVLEVVRAFEASCGTPVPFKIVPRRVGDVGISIADAKRAFDLSGWKPCRSLAQTTKDLLRWAKVDGVE